MKNQKLKYVAQIEANKPVTIAAIIEALDVHDWEVLYYAKEQQICSLIDQGKISEDFSARWDDYQEEMRCLMADFS